MFRLILIRTPTREEQDQIEKGGRSYREEHGQVSPTGLALFCHASSGWESELELTMTGELRWASWSARW
jgi:hypothetical protein